MRYEHLRKIILESLSRRDPYICYAQTQGTNAYGKCLELLSRRDPYICFALRLGTNDYESF